MLAGYEVLPLTHRQLKDEADWVVRALRTLLAANSNVEADARRAVPVPNV
jgi:hypothetical protein